MRVERHKKEITFLGWVLVSSLLLIAAARAEDNTYSATAGLPKNNSSSEDILRRAKTTLPAEQYQAFEKAMRKLDGGAPQSTGAAGNAVGPNRAGVPGEAIIDGSTIPATISFDRQAQPAPDRAPAEAQPAQPTPVEPAPAQPVPTTPNLSTPDQPPAPAPVAVPAPTTVQGPAPASVPAPAPKPEPAPAKPATPKKPAKSTQFYDPSFPSPDPIR